MQSEEVRMSKYNVGDLVAVKKTMKGVVECERITKVLEVKDSRKTEHIGLYIYLSEGAYGETAQYIHEDDIVGKVMQPN